MANMVNKYKNLNNGIAVPLLHFEAT